MANVIRSRDPRRGNDSRVKPGRTRYTDRVPTVHRDGPYRFFFYSADRNEPVHVHVERDASRAKFWLQVIANVSPLSARLLVTPEFR
jgi:hypothetical protein